MKGKDWLLKKHVLKKKLKKEEVKKGMMKIMNISKMMTRNKVMVNQRKPLKRNYLNVHTFKQKLLIEMMVHI